MLCLCKINLGETKERSGQTNKAGPAVNSTSLNVLREPQVLKSIIRREQDPFIERESALHLTEAVVGGLNKPPVLCFSADSGLVTPSFIPSVSCGGT